ncbi:response regulator transcription factor [Rhizobium sp. WYJ-E13]|uniref:response regulator transcription factor n=1 Tax=Rhizobium sp. WYJ-E13 TaxID=2849093 RepID=UPI001C1ED9BC|nr:response regulator transcription factor [Rhizobium sp. WYJ-E13]QWW72584.1 response regulator transcription factor [Rhizobium sp. WYJ-E13]
MNGAVHVIDDDCGIRDALESLFRSVGYEVYKFASTHEFLDAGKALSSGCLVLDVRLPGMNGLDFQKYLSDAAVTMPIVFMTGHGDIPMTVRGIKAGAIDFLPKPFREQDMLDAVAAALEKDLVERQAQRHRRQVLDRYESLSMREREVMAQVARGLLNKQIAHALGISEITVKIHRGNAMRKLETRNLAEFIRIAQTFQPVS